MAKRGMLPKFRPASLGRDAQARPSIRPVRPSPPPPPPTPPRKNHPSGFGAKGGVAAAEAARHHHEQFTELSTAPGTADPSTLSRGPETVPIDRALQNARDARHGRAKANAALTSFDDETQARPLEDHLADNMMRAPKAPPPADLGVAYDSLPSLEVRPPYDTYEAEFSEREPVTQLQDAHHESAQVLRRADAAREPSYKESSYKESSYKEPSTPSYSDAEPPSFLRPSLPDSFPANDAQAQSEQQERWARREESGPRERPAPESASDQWGRDRAEPATGFSSMPARRAEMLSYEQPPIPPAPRVPEEMRPAFVVGVQPVRGVPTEAWGTPRVQPQQQMPSPMQAIHSSMPAGYAQPQHAQPQHAQPQYAPQYAPTALQPQYPQQMQMQQHPNTVAASPRALTPYPGTPYPPHQRSASPTPAPAPAPMMQSGMSPSMMAQPVSSQLAPVPSTAKVGRFAWFVAGAAFGITFAFFATGVFSPKPAADFPAAAPLPALTAPAATSPVAGAPGTIAPPAATTPVATTPPAAAPVPPAAGASAPVVQSAPVVTPPPAPTVRTAPPPPPPVVRRPAPPPRRPAAPAAPAVPKSIGGGGGDDEAPPRAPAPAAPSGDLGDLLGAGLKP